MIFSRCFSRGTLAALWLSFCTAIIPSAQAWENDPPPPDGTAEATKAMAAFRVPEGFKVELFAAEPMLGAPVALCLDEQGRVYTAEEYRFNRGTEENRTRPFLLEDDLQIQTLNDRLKMFHKFADQFEGGMDWFTKYSDQVRRLEDKNGDGRAEISTVFAGKFNGILDGMASGVIARDGDVYLTCIPNLWHLRDNDGDGVAEVREAVHTGFGINAAFLGHDLHGLAWGPDGKLYFSIGDRGFHVETKEGETLHGPRTGGVFRCNPDGTALEVVARGMRNPQEIAFDQYGNLFAVDNNCDKGDHSRLVYVVEGGNSGWNMSYQSLEAPYLTGPWHAEQIWHLPPAEHQPAWIVPPVGKIGAGPSGFVYYPGLGLPKKFANHFFYCNYTGNGGVESFAVEQQGAGFKIVDHQDFLKPVMATDVDFGYDGKVYVSDFVQLHWNGGPAKGRIFTVKNDEALQNSLVKANAELFRAGFKQLKNDELVKIIRDSRDLRARQRAQFELAARGVDGMPALESLLSDDQLLPRLHGIWGLGQIATAQVDLQPQVLAALLPLLEDQEEEVRSQSARVLGEQKNQQASEPLLKLLVRNSPLLADASPRVQFFAVMALTKLPSPAIVEPIFELIRANNDEDLFVRHAGVMALSAAASPDVLVAHAHDASPAVRMAVLLALRKLEDARIALFLNDAEPRLVTEAARAINDLPRDEANAQLAVLLPRLSGASPIAPDALVRRALHANFRLGTLEAATAVAQYAANTQNPVHLRAEAIASLSDWEKPGQRDRVNGFWRPLAERSVEIPREAVSRQLAQLLAGAEGDLSAAVVKLISGLGIETSDKTFLTWVRDVERPVSTRVEALKFLASRKSPALTELVEQTLTDQQPLLRATSRELVAKLDPIRGLELLSAATEQGEMQERQLAFAALSQLADDEAASVLAAWFDKLSAGKVEPEYQLDVLEAARASANQTFQSKIAAYESQFGDRVRLENFKLALVGGDVERGKRLFTSSAMAQCVRCHKIEGNGGDAGPDLSKVAARNPRDYLLQSILEPNAKIAPGFATVTLQLSDGRVVAGTLKSEENGKLTIVTPQSQTLVIDAADIDDRSQPTSAMPEIFKGLTPAEVRDLVAYLATLK